MPEDSPKGESCQLETRHWIITGEDGHEEMVDGPGVVGKYIGVQNSMQCSQG